MSQESSAYKTSSPAGVFVLAKSMGLQLGADAARHFAKGGYVHLAGIPFSSDWKAAHTWCQEVAGEGNYSWAGGTFGFRDPEVATMFKLSFG